MANKADRKEVFTVIEREGRDGKKNWWVRIGTAFVNRDGSLNVKLDALPVNGTMQIRDPLPDDERRSGGSRGNDRGRSDDRRDERDDDRGRR